MSDRNDYPYSPHEFQDSGYDPSSSGEYPQSSFEPSYPTGPMPQPPMQERPSDGQGVIGYAIKSTLTAVKGNLKAWGLWLLIQILFGAALVGLAVAFYVLFDSKYGNYIHYDDENGGFYTTFMSSDMQNDATHLGVILVLVFIVIAFFYSWFSSITGLNLARHSANGSDTALGKVFDFTSGLRYLGLSIIVGLISIVSIVTIVGPLIVWFFFFYSAPILVDQRTGVFESIRNSCKVAKSNVATTVLALLTIIALYIIISVLGIIPIIGYVMNVLSLVVSPLVALFGIFIVRTLTGINSGFGGAAPQTQQVPESPYGQSYPNPYQQ